MASGAPDYQRVFTLVPPSMTHGAPDWQRTAVGPGGAPVSGITPLGHILADTIDIVSGGVTNIGLVNLSNTAPGYAMLAFAVEVQYSITSVPGEGLIMEAGGDLTSYVSSVIPLVYVNPGVIVTNATVTATWAGLVYLTRASAVVALDVSATPTCTGSCIIGVSAPVLGVWQ